MGHHAGETMRFTLLNGAHARGDATDQLCDAAEALLEHEGAVERFDLHDVTLAFCQGCFHCWVKTPGECKSRDDGEHVAAALINSDLVIYVTPVTFGGYASPLKKALDRSISLLSPHFARIDGETHHRKRYARYPAIYALGTLPHPDAAQQAIFGMLVARNAVNMHAPVQCARVCHLDRGAAAFDAALGDLIGFVQALPEIVAPQAVL